MHEIRSRAIFITTVLYTYLEVYVTCLSIPSCCMSSCIARVRLIDEERLKSEEAQRKTILNLNALGAVARLILEAQGRVSKTT